MKPILAAVAVAASPLVPAAARAQASEPVSLEKVAAGLRAGTWASSSRVRGEGRSEEVGRRTVTVVPSSYGGASAWLLLDAQHGAQTRATDSLFVSRDDLGSIHRVTRIAGPLGDLTLTMDFTPDSVKGQLAGGGQSQTLAMANTPGSVSGDAVVLAAMSAMPLARGWTASMQVLNPQARGVTPLTLRVVGTERVTVPAGTFDAWVVEAAGGGATATYFVARGGPVVKVVANLRQLGAASVETVLERATTGR